MATERNVELVGQRSSMGPQWITPGRLGWLLFGLACLGVGGGVLVFPPLYVLASIGAILGVVLLFYYPFLGALGYLVFEYARLSAMFPVLRPLQVGKLIVAVSVVAWAVKSVTDGNFRIVRDRINWIMLAWTALAFVAAYGALVPVNAIEGATQLVKWVMMYFLFIYLLDTLSKWRWFMLTYLLLNLKLSQFQLRSYAFGLQAAYNQDHFVQQGVGAGSTSFLSNATDFGAAMAVVLPFALYLMLAAKQTLLRLLGMVSLVAFSLSILRSGSRGAALALFAMAAVYWWRSRNKAITGFVVALLLIGFWAIAPPAWQQRFVSAKEYQKDSTASSRLDYWKAGIRMMFQHPITGVGLENFPANYLAGGGDEEIVPHSIFIQAASELGVPGIIILLSLIYLVYARNRAIRNPSAGMDADSVYRRKMAFALELSLVGFVVGGTFLTTLYYPHIYVIAGMTVSLYQITLASNREDTLTSCVREA